MILFTKEDGRNQKRIRSGRRMSELIPWYGIVQFNKDPCDQKSVHGAEPHIHTNEARGHTKVAQGDCYKLHGSIVILAQVNIGTG